LSGLPPTVRTIGGEFHFGRVAFAVLIAGEPDQLMIEDFKVGAGTENGDYGEYLSTIECQIDVVLESVKNVIGL
jgi:hypothetical protein